MLGYHKAYAEEYLDRNGYFRTGDTAYLDDTGMLHWGGRVSNMIRTAGVNVSPVEIESKLSLWGRLKVAAVVPILHPRLDEAVVLCAVPHHDDAVRPEDVVEHLKTVLASYKVPKRVLIVDEDDLTHTSSGEKLKTTDLKRLAARLIAAADDWGAHLRAAHPSCSTASAGGNVDRPRLPRAQPAATRSVSEVRTRGPMAIDYIAVIEDEAARILMPTGRTPAARCRGPTAGA